MFTRMTAFVPFRAFVGILAFSFLTSELRAQVTAPTVLSSTTFNLTPGITLAGSMSNATNQNLPGWTQRLYGSTGGAFDTGIDITATSGSPASLRFDTRTVASSASAAADNFTINDKPNYFQYRWNVFRPATGSNSLIQSGLFNTPNFTPSIQGDLVTYNTILNNILKFNPNAVSGDTTQPGFINPHTGSVIVPGPTVGWFSFEFSNFVSGIGYRNIDLVFTVAPEPGTTLAIAAAGLGIITGISRRLRKNKVQTA